MFKICTSILVNGLHRPILFTYVNICSSLDTSRISGLIATAQKPISKGRQKTFQGQTKTTSKIKPS